MKVDKSSNQIELKRNYTNSKIFGNGTNNNTKISVDNEAILDSEGIPLKTTSNQKVNFESNSDDDDELIENMNENTKITLT